MSDFKTFKELFRDLYYRNITIGEAESKQEEYNLVLHLLKKHDKYVTLKNNLVDNASKVYEGRVLLKGLKAEYFHFVIIEIMRNEWRMKKKKKKKQ